MATIQETIQSTKQNRYIHRERNRESIRNLRYNRLYVGLIGILIALGYALITTHYARINAQITHTFNVQSPASIPASNYPVYFLDGEIFVDYGLTSKRTTTIFNIPDNNEVTEQFRFIGQYNGEGTFEQGFVYDESITGLDSDSAYDAIPIGSTSWEQKQSPAGYIQSQLLKHGFDKVLKGGRIRDQYAMGYAYNDYTGAYGVRINDTMEVYDDTGVYVTSLNKGAYVYFSANGTVTGARYRNRISVAGYREGFETTFHIGNYFLKLPDSGGLNFEDI